MEQALVFASIIIGVAVSDQILSLHRLLRSEAPVKWHWAQPWFALIVLLLNVMIWWSIASPAEPQGAMTIGSFLPMLVLLILLALLTASSLPDRIGDEGIDLADYYQSNRKYQWSVVALGMAWQLGNDVFEGARDGIEAAQFVSNRWGDIFAVLLMAGMIFIRRWWMVAVGMALLSIGPVGWLSRSLG